jgi:hexosaminidase
VICRDKFWSLYAAEPPAGQLNPLHPGAHSLVKDIVTEAAQRFPDTLYHTGGDEINNLCWESHSEVRDHLQRYQITTKQLWLDWEDKLLRHVIKDLKKRPIIWEDALKDGGSLPKETIVQIWTTPASTYTSQGHDVIVSSYDYFYFDCGHGGNKREFLEGVGG